MQVPESISGAGPLFCLLMIALAVGGCGGVVPVEPATDAEVGAADQALRLERTQRDAGPSGIVNYTRIDATVACAGATPPETMSELKKRGFASVVNFRTVSEYGATVKAGQAAAEEAGLRYFHLPFRTPTAQLAERFLDTVANPANEPLYIHCGSGGRVGAMWLIKRVKQDGWDVDRALAEAEAIGLNSARLKRFALDYLNSSWDRKK